MLNNIDFLTKELVASYGYTNFDEDRTLELTKNFEGIDFHAEVHYLATAVAGFVYKCRDKENGNDVYVLFGGVAYESDELNNAELMTEAAKEQASENPKIVMQFDEMPDKDVVEDMMSAYLCTTSVIVTQ